jgi:repressor LexA
MKDALIIRGLIEAGFPTSASEEMLDTMSLDEYLIENKESTYMLKVKGNSMKDAGILPGDLILVERGAEARTGNIVLVETGGAYTLKYFKDIKSIRAEEELKVAAVVRSVIRKYSR